MEREMNQHAQDDSGLTVAEPIVVELSMYNLLASAFAGSCRNVSLIKQEIGYKGINNRKRGWQDHIDGALGEQAFAKWLDVYWDGTPNTFRTKPDVAKYEVRTACLSWGDLILRDRDKDDAIYVLVLSHNCPEFTIRGWIWGHEGKQAKWRGRLDKSRPEAWIVPQSELRDMSSLPR